MGEVVVVCEEEPVAQAVVHADDARGPVAGVSQEPAR